MCIYVNIYKMFRTLPGTKTSVRVWARVRMCAHHVFALTAVYLECFSPFLQKSVGSTMAGFSEGRT